MEAVLEATEGNGISVGGFLALGSFMPPGQFAVDSWALSTKFSRSDIF